VVGRILTDRNQQANPLELLSAGKIPRTDFFQGAEVMKRSIRFALVLVSVVCCAALRAESYSTLLSFDWPTGAMPRTGLTQIGSTLYGATAGGGSTGGGTLYSIGTDGGNYKVLHTFQTVPNDGFFPDWGALTAVNSVLYGTTTWGGTVNNAGIVFKMNANGTGYSVLHAFNGGNDGSHPNCALTQVGTTLYGTTSEGGSNDRGTIFSVDSSGLYRTLFSFNGADKPGPMGGLTLVGSALYGTTYLGGRYGYGTIFKFDPSGAGYQDLYDFTGEADGMQPWGKLATDGTYFYGVNSAGAANQCGVLYRVKCDGTGFTVLHNNLGGTFICQQPTLVGSTLYCTGSELTTTSNDLYQINTDGSGFRELRSFGSICGPSGGLVVAGSTIYGTAEAGGAHNYGFLYALQVPEPSAIALLLTAILGSLLWWRRRS
jgi:uncharacterized repeat protein (TIGR03803 family)